MIFYINSLIDISVSIMQSSIEKHFENIIKNNESMDDLLNTWNSKENKKSLGKILKKFSSTRKKKVKGPKKVRSAYLYFCEAERPKIRNDKPELSPTEILSECGTRWSLIKDKPKMVKKYKDLSEKDKDRYNKEKESFIPDESESSDDENPKKKKKKNTSNGLKKNKTSFLFFSTDERQRIKDEGLEISAKEILTEIGIRWKAFQESNPNGLKKYEQMASEDKIRYENEKSNLNSPPETSDEVVDEVVEEKVEKPKSKRSNGYVNFCREKRPEVKEENSDVSAPKINSILAEMWKELSDEDKTGYNTN